MANFISVCQLSFTFNPFTSGRSLLTQGSRRSHQLIPSGRRKGHLDLHLQLCNDSFDREGLSSTSVVDAVPGPTALDKVVGLGSNQSLGIGDGDGDDDDDGMDRMKRAILDCCPHYLVGRKCPPTLSGIKKAQIPLPQISGAVTIIPSTLY